MLTMDDPAPPRAAACPELQVLPRITPELLYFASFKREAPRLALMLGLSDVVFAFDGRLYVMSEWDWQLFQQMMGVSMVMPAA